MMAEWSLHATGILPLTNFLESWKKHFSILQNDPALRTVFKEAPLVAFRRAKTIRNEIVRSDIANSAPEVLADGTTPCQKCKTTCHLLFSGSTFTNNKTGCFTKLEKGCNCDSKNVVYVARCIPCGLVYVGETKESLKIRFSKHRYDARKRPDNCELARHMYDQKHDFEKDLEITVLKQGFKSDQERKFFEDKFICALGTLGPQDGLNALSKCGAYVKEMYAIH